MKDGDGKTKDIFLVSNQEFIEKENFYWQMRKRSVRIFIELLRGVCTATFNM